jgi:hypothetical protein
MYTGRNMTARGRATEGFLYINSKNLRGFTETEIQDLKEAKEKISSVLNNRSKYLQKYTGYSAVLVNVQNALEKLMQDRRARLQVNNENAKKLEPEEIQKRRREVLLMVRNGYTLPGIKIFQGKDIDGDPVVFFQNNYARYIVKNLETIFTVDLLKIDHKLLTALRNNVRSESMPIGDRTAKTNAIYEGRFSEGVGSKMAAHVAQATRIQRAKKIHARLA